MTTQTTNQRTRTLEVHVSTGSTRTITYVEPIAPPSNFRLVSEFVIKGKPGRKSNSRQIVRNPKTDKPMVIKSSVALSYAKQFGKQVTDEMKVGVGSEKEVLAVWANMYYPSNRQDISIEMITDLMQKHGIISNDRWVKCHLLFGAIDRDNPRVHIRLYVVE